MNTRALEAGARAICIAVGDDPDESTYAREMVCSGNERGPQARWQYWTEHATAVITAYEAHLKAEGFVVVEASRLAQHVAWLRVFIDESKPENWRDMQLRSSRQLDDVEAMLSAATTGENDALPDGERP